MCVWPDDWKEGDSGDRDGPMAAHGKRLGRGFHHGDSGLRPASTGEDLGS